MAAAVFYSSRCRSSPAPPFPSESRAPELEGAAVGENRALEHSTPGESELEMSYWGGLGSIGGGGRVVGCRGRLADSAGWCHSVAARFVRHGGGEIQGARYDGAAAEEAGVWQRGNQGRRC
jgi:hypothetical protein